MGLTKLTGFSGEAIIMGTPRAVEYVEGRGLMLHGVQLIEAHMILNRLNTGSVQAINLPISGQPYMQQQQPPQGPQQGPRQTAPAPQNVVPPPAPPAERAQEEQPLEAAPEAGPAPAAAQSAAAETTAAAPAEEKQPRKRNRAAKQAEAAPEAAPAAAAAPAQPAATEAPTAAAAAPVQDTGASAQDDLPGSLGQAGQGAAPSNVVALPTAQAAAPAPTGDDAQLIAVLATYKRLGDILAELDERGYKTAEQMLAVAERVKAQVPVLRTIPSLTLDRFKRALATMRGDSASA